MIAADPTARRAQGEPSARTERLASNCSSTGARWSVGLSALLCALIGPGCGPSESPGSATNVPLAVEGRPIRALDPASKPTVNAEPAGSANKVRPAPRPETVVDGHLELGFETLSSFPYRIYEYHVEGGSGRPLLKSDDTIPELIKKLDGRKVTIRGFVLPLRTRKGKVTEFLLMRDQGTCCFGPQAQINHFIRVNFPGGRELTSGLSRQVSGQLRVGETYVQGYLTGIYQLEATAVSE